ncbi:hypothetical protein TNCV_570401 [Trichonephila clavipes]|nr:hypothetical protein TNCV_570401 [Trichonephila clavipes]
MRPLEDDGKNGWTMADFSILMVADDLGLLQIRWRYPPGLIFQHDNAKLHTARVSMTCLTAYQTLFGPVRSPDPSAIEHVWDMVGGRLHLPGNVDDPA